MSLATFEDLKLEIIDWSHRGDVDLKIDTFIQLAESEMYANQIEPLKIRSEETLATATMDSTTPSRFVALPAGFQSMRKLSLQIVNGENFEIDFRTPSQQRDDLAPFARCRQPLQSDMAHQVPPKRGVALLQPTSAAGPAKSGRPE